jgi:hypothetical protein
MPPPKKPPGTRQRTNTAEVGHLAVVPPTEPAPDPPRPPTKGNKQGTMLPATVAAWAAFWESSVAALVDRSSDLPSLRRLFLLYDKRARIEREVATSGMVTIGSTGQLVLHPLEKQLPVIDGQITALEDRFGLTPMARLKLGVTFGEAHRSLDAMNERLNAGGADVDDDDDDPRRGVIDTTATG